MDAGTTDEAIVARVQQGDAEQFGVLMERYQNKLMRYGRRFLADREDVTDIVHDVFMQSYKNIQSFDSAQRFSPWIYRIAHNAFVNEIRRKSHRPFTLLDFDTLVGYVPYDDPVEGERERADMKRVIERGLQTLRPRDREILVLFYLEELSYKEIAEVLKIPLGTVGVRVSRAKVALRTAYTDLKLTYDS